MGFVNAGIDGTAFPSLPRPLRSGRDKLRNFWGSGEPKVWGCEEEEESSQMCLHVETGLLRLLWSFVCSAFRRNPAREQRSGQKCRYLFIQENSQNNTYLGAFRNNRTRPTELLNQFGGNSPAHTHWAGAGTPAEAAGTRAPHPSRAQHPSSHPGGLWSFPGIPPSTGRAPIPGLWAEQSPSKGLTLGVRGRISSVPGVNQRRKVKCCFLRGKNLECCPQAFQSLDCWCLL